MGFAESFVESTSEEKDDDPKENKEKRLLMK